MFSWICRLIPFFCNASVALIARSLFLIFVIVVASLVLARLIYDIIKHRRGQ